MKKVGVFFILLCFICIFALFGCKDKTNTDVFCSTDETNKEILECEYDFYGKIDLPSGYMSDHTIVGDELWVFFASDDDHINYSYVNRYKLNIADNDYIHLGQFKHNFGHCNTVDYCDETDTLILGNGGGSENKQNDQIYIIENASNLKNFEQVNLFNVAKIIDLDSLGLDFGKQANVCWGEANRGNWDIIYVLSNSNGQKNINKILLGKGSNNLEYGTILNVSENEFNGTFRILSTYIKEYSLTYCNQGTQYYRGKLFEAMGHDSIFIAINTFYESGKMKTAYFKSFYFDSTGEKYNRVIAEGIAIKDGFMFVGCDDKDLGCMILIYKI